MVIDYLFRVVHAARTDLDGVNSLSKVYKGDSNYKVFIQCPSPVLDHFYQ